MVVAWVFLEEFLQICEDAAQDLPSGVESVAIDTRTCLQRLGKMVKGRRQICKFGSLDYEEEQFSCLDRQSCKTKSTTKTTTTRVSSRWHRRQVDECVVEGGAAVGVPSTR